MKFFKKARKAKMQESADMRVLSTSELSELAGGRPCSSPYVCNKTTCVDSQGVCKA